MSVQQARPWARAALDAADTRVGRRAAGGARAQRHLLRRAQAGSRAARLVVRAEEAVVGARTPLAVWGVEPHLVARGGKQKKNLRRIQDSSDEDASDDEE